MNKNNEMSAKVIVLGDTSVGKSSIIQRYFENTFDEHLPNTIGAAFQTDNFFSKDKTKSVKMNVWDTCGQERFMSIASVYYKDANIILLVIDASQGETLEVAKKYFEEILNHANADPIVMLVVNKVDLLDTTMQLTKVDDNLKKKCSFYSKIEKFINEKDIEHVFWTSAKENGINVKEMFHFIGNGILENRFRIKNDPNTAQKNVIGLSYIGPAKKDKKCC